LKFNSKTRLLVVAAHPDDEILGCGGTLAKAKKQGCNIRVVFLGEGVSARFTIGEYNSKEFSQQSKQRELEAETALKTLGIADSHFGKRLCTQFDTYPLLSIVKDIENQIASFKPDILLTHNPSEVNIDHRITYEAVEIACRPTRKDLPQEIYTFEVVCSGNFKFSPYFIPNVFIDISDTWDEKMEAWSSYAGEAKDYPFPRSEEGLETLAKFRGMSCGLEKAEAFHLVRKLA